MSRTDKVIDATMAVLVVAGGVSAWVFAALWFTAFPTIGLLWIIGWLP